MKLSHTVDHSVKRLDSGLDSGLGSGERPSVLLSAFVVAYAVWCLKGKDLGLRQGVGGEGGSQ